MSIDPAAVTRFIEETAAEEVLPRFCRLAEGDVRRKAAGELVTAADVACEARLTRLLRDHLPGSQVVGEEAAAERPEILALLGGADPVWLVDPVDGTANFAAGRPTFAVMVALVEKGAIVAAWIHEPILARSTVAEAGGGAWTGDRRLAVAAPVELAGMRGTLHVGTFGSPALARRIEAVRESLGVDRSLRCAGAEYVRLAAGEMHYTLFTKMMPWDHAPGVLLYDEAGGLARTFDRQAYDPSRRDTPGLLLAPDEASWAALHEMLLG